MKIKIKKLCIASPTDDHKIKAIKSPALTKVNYRFPDCDRIKLHQLLDAQTKSMIPRPSVSTLLEEAVKHAIERKLTTVSDSDFICESNRSIDINNEDEEPTEKIDDSTTK